MFNITTLSFSGGRLEEGEAWPDTVSKEQFQSWQTRIKNYTVISVTNQLKSIQNEQQNA